MPKSPPPPPRGKHPGRRPGAGKRRPGTYAYHQAAGGKWVVKRQAGKG